MYRITNHNRTTDDGSYDNDNIDSSSSIIPESLLPSILTNKSIHRDTISVVDSQTHKFVHPHNQICCCADIEAFLELMNNENPWILSGFREYTTRSYKQCLKSVFILHNDTLNIWTHLIPSIAYFIAFTNRLLYYYGDDYGGDGGRTEQQSNYHFNICIFLLSCSICFFVSSIYHTFRSHSVSVFKTTLMMDVMGIALSIIASVNLMIGSELVCFQKVRQFFLFSFFFLIATALSLLPKIMREKKFSLRTFILSVLASQGLVAHLLRYKLDGNLQFETLKNIILAYSFLTVALMVRKFKVPEKFYPGRFDIWFSSHQIFHTLVVIGTYFIYLAYGDGLMTCISLVENHGDIVDSIPS